MQFTIELDREEDGRWIADIPQLNVLLYGATKEEVVQKAESAAREIIADRIHDSEDLGPVILAKISKKTGFSPADL